MKPTLLILLLLFSFPLIAQERLLVMSKVGSQKSRVFKENMRVKVKNLDGEKYIGRFEIIDANSIEIEGNVIPLSAISNIKSRTAIAGIASTAIILYGVVVLVVGYVSIAIGGASGNTGYVALGAISAAIVSTGIFFNEFARNYRHRNEWTYKIIEE